VDTSSSGSVRGIHTATGYALGTDAVAIGYNTTASGGYSFAQGYSSLATNLNSFVEGEFTTASGQASHAEGGSTTAEGDASHAEGGETLAQGDASHAEGVRAEALDIASHAEGYETIAEGAVSHAEGFGTMATDQSSHSEGYYTVASGVNSHAANYRTIAQGAAQTAIGMYNKPQGDSPNPSITDNVLIIGNGSSAATSNAFRFQYNGQAYGSNWNTSGADYAEMFEWEDGNPELEDRAGYFVTVQDGKILKAAAADKYILGVISATPSVIGDCQGLGWRDMYQRDEFGRIIHEQTQIESEVPDNVDTWRKSSTKLPHVPVKKEITLTYRPKLNPAYDPTKKYISRDNRPEWAAVGIVGKLIVRDDGSCEVNGFCKTADGGIATASESGYFVLERVAEDKIRIMVK